MSRVPLFSINFVIFIFTPPDFLDLFRSTRTGTGTSTTCRNYGYVHVVSDQLKYSYNTCRFLPTVVYLTTTVVYLTTAYILVLHVPVEGL